MIKTPNSDHFKWEDWIMNPAIWENNTLLYREGPANQVKSRNENYSNTTQDEA